MSSSFFDHKSGTKVSTKSKGNGFYSDQRKMVKPAEPIQEMPAPVQEQPVQIMPEMPVVPTVPEMPMSPTVPEMPMCPMPMQMPTCPHVMPQMTQQVFPQMPVTMPMQSHGCHFGCHGKMSMDPPVMNPMVNPYMPDGYNYLPGMYHTFHDHGAMHHNDCDNMGMYGTPMQYSMPHDMMGESYNPFGMNSYSDMNMPIMSDKASNAMISDPPPVLSNNPSTVDVTFFKELTGYPNYGNPSGNADILYTGNRGTWTFDIPQQLINMFRVRGRLEIRGVLDDHNNVATNRYSATIIINGVTVHTGRLPFEHGTPSGSRFTNWRTLSFNISNLRRDNRIVIVNTSTAGPNDWIGLDWMQLRLVPV